MFTLIMVPDEGIVTTDVDALIRVVQEKKEVSVPDVAKELDVSEDTIEAWATFLEEEGILEIKYKFTKPFLVAKKEVEVPKEAKPKPHKQLEKEVAEKLAEKAEKEKPEEEAPEEELEKPAAKPKEKAVEEAKELYKEAKERIGKGEIDKARELLHKLRDEYEHLPDEFTTKKEHLISEMVDLNEKLINSIDKFARQEMRLKKKKIKTLIKKAKKQAKRKKFKEADATFAECKKLLSSMPEGFFEEKTHIQESLLHLHDDIVKIRSTVHTKEVKDIVAEINKIIASGEKVMLREDVEKAEKAYLSVKELMKKLPKGFVKEKLALHDVITDYHNDLIEMKAEINRGQLEVKKRKLTKLLDSIKSNLKKRDIGRAIAFYEEAQKLHTELPMSFLEKEVELEKRFVGIGKKVATVTIKEHRKDMREKAKKMSSLMSMAKRYIRRKEPELGAKVYTDMTKLYSELPKGFLDQKTKLRKHMLKIYEKTVLASDIQFLQGVDEKLKKRYKELVTLLVTFQKHIDDKEFSELDKDARFINKVYEGLPIAFIRKKLKLVDEITRANDLVAIHNKTKLIKQIPATRYKEIKGVLDDIYKLYNKVVRKYPEDNELLTHVKETCSPYSLKLAAKGMIKKSRAGFDIKKELARMKKEKEKQKKKLQNEAKLKAERKKLLKQEAQAERERILKHIEDAKKEERRELKARADLLKEIKELGKKREKLLKEELSIEGNIKKEKQEGSALKRTIKSQEDQVRREFGDLEAAKLKMQLRSGELKALKQKYAEASKLYNELKSKRKKVSSKLLLEAVKREKKKLAEKIRLQKAEQKKLALTKQQHKFMKEVEKVEEHRSFLARFFGKGKKKEIELAPPKEETEKLEKKAEREEKKSIQHLAKELQLKQDQAKRLYSEGIDAIRQARKDMILNKRKEYVNKVFNKHKLDSSNILLEESPWEEWALMQSLGVTENDLIRWEETIPLEKVDRVKKKHQTTHDVALMFINQGKKAENGLKKIRKDQRDLAKQLTKKCRLTPADAKIIAREGSEIANQLTQLYDKASHERKIAGLMKKHRISREEAETILEEGRPARRMLKEAEEKLGEEEKDIMKELHVGREEADILLAEGKKAMEMVRGSYAEIRQNKVRKILHSRGIENESMLDLIEETPYEEIALMRKLGTSEHDLELWREATSNKKLNNAKKKHKVTKEMALIIANMGKIATNELKKIRKEERDLAKLLVKEHKLTKTDARTVAKEGKEFAEAFMSEHQKELHEKQITALMKHHGLSHEGAEIILSEGIAAKEILKEAEKKLVEEKKEVHAKKERKSRLEKLEDSINEKLAALSQYKVEEKTVIISTTKHPRPVTEPEVEVAEEKPKPKKELTKKDKLQQQQEEIERKLASLSKFAPPR